MPFTQTEALTEQKMKMANQLVELYGNEKTIKTVVTKQTDFKKNLEK